MKSESNSAGTIAVPREGAGPEASLRRNRRVLYALGGVVGAAELATLVAAPPIGAVLLPSSALLGFVAHRGQKLASSQQARAIAEAVTQQERLRSIDAETGLPNRQNLLDQLAREIARAERYSYDVTLALVEIQRLNELEAAWGAGAAARAIGHVAETLKRITRTSDFLARIGEARFGVALMQCSAGQAQAFGDRAALAIANRPLAPDEHMRVPVYVNVRVSAQQYDRGRFRGPLEFLSAAGGDIPPVRPGRTATGTGGTAAVDVRDLRRQLVHGYEPLGRTGEPEPERRARRTG